MGEADSIGPIEIGELFRLLPHRYPFLLIDRIESMDGDNSAIGIKNVTVNEPHFNGHFPGEPIMPGVLIVEAMAQTAGAITAKVHSGGKRKLVYFMTKFLNMRTRIAISLLGLTHRVPHVDVYGSDPKTGIIGLRFKADMAMPVRWILLRIGILAGAGLLFYVFYLGAVHIPYFGLVLGGLFGLVALILALSIVVIWAHNAVTGKFLLPLVDLHLRLIRLGLVITAYFTFVTNEISEFNGCFRSVLDESVPSDLSSGNWINPNDSRRLDINLIVLVVLSVTTQSLYLFIWLGRTSRIMGDDPFTIIAVTFLGALLPLSVIFSRYYRRLEKKTGNEPSWLIELLMIIPFLNLVAGTFTIQYILNLGRKTAQ